jgi:hypothetical protein
MLSTVMLNVVMLTVIILNVVAPPPSHFNTENTWHNMISSQKNALAFYPISLKVDMLGCFLYNTEHDSILHNANNNNYTQLNDIQHNDTA